MYIYIVFSTVSSGQNALAAVVVTDLIEPIYLTRQGRHLSATSSFIVAKVIGEYMVVYAVQLLLEANICYIIINTRRVSIHSQIYIFCSYINKLSSLIIARLSLVIARSSLVIARSS